ncbi:hypothetical protein [Hymenobacter cellulosilyticus]|uniref:Uncharacterized protein n=1 Tax=Hymenobacter cellulosilyticus TaxID=2932248 RepID=A0A8T9Q795_9BACT|nr:hypothetical protein [Hymenobacter cellulosilyticus]UOQ73005.1 hypothetical protein MUN79_03225 [Hymenobacter cellulosilyticus]
MKVNSGIRVLVLAMTLLTGCRSEKVAFQFRPPAPVAAVAPSPTATPAAPESGAPTPQAQAAVAAPKAPEQRLVSRAVAAAPARKGRPLLRRARAEAQSIRAWQKAHKPRRATDDGEADVLHVVLGSLLIIGGIILGLLLGGWLGLGVGRQWYCWAIISWLWALAGPTPGWKSSRSFSTCSLGAGQKPVAAARAPELSGAQTAATGFWYERALGVALAFLGAAAVAFPAGFILAAGVIGTAGYGTFLGAAGLAGYSGSFLAGFATVGVLGSLLAVFHGFK